MSGDEPTWHMPTAPPSQAEVPIQQDWTPPAADPPASYPPPAYPPPATPTPPAGYATAPPDDPQGNGLLRWLLLALLAVVILGAVVVGAVMLLGPNADGEVLSCEIAADGTLSATGWVTGADGAILVRFDDADRGVEVARQTITVTSSGDEQFQWVAGGQADESVQRVTCTLDLP